MATSLFYCIYNFLDRIRSSLAPSYLRIDRINLMFTGLVRNYFELPAALSSTLTERRHSMTSHHYLTYTGSLKYLTASAHCNGQASLSFPLATVSCPRIVNLLSCQSQNHNTLIKWLDAIMARIYQTNRCHCRLHLILLLAKRKYWYKWSVASPY